MIIIGICGGSGSGKSTLAKNLKKGFSGSTCIITQDCYYNNHPELSMDERALLDYDSLEAFNFQEMYEDISALTRNQRITVKGYNYAKHLREDRQGEFIEPPEVLILEGIHLFHDKRLCDLMNLKVYIDVDPDTCLIRRAERDMKNRDRSIGSIFRQYEATVKPALEKYIKGYVKEADISVREGGNNIKAIEVTNAYIEKKIKAE